MVPLHELGRQKGGIMTYSAEYLTSLSSRDPVRMPATDALENSGLIPAREYKRARLSPNSALSSFKSRRNKNIFDMEELINATKPVEESVSFPTIEWSWDDNETDDTRSPAVFLNDPLLVQLKKDQVKTDEGEDGDEDDDGPLKHDYSCLGKRSRSYLGVSSGNRLVRSKALKSDLFLLEDSIRPLPPPKSGFYRSEKPRSNDLCQLSFDVDKWIELADITSSETSPKLRPSLNTASSRSRQDETVHTQCGHTLTV